MLLRTLSAGGAGAEQGGQGGRVAGSLHREGIDLDIYVYLSST